VRIARLGRRAVEDSPSDTSLLFVLGFMLLHAGQPREAVPVLEKSLAANTWNSAWASGPLGLAQARLGHREQARSALAAALRLPADVSGWWPDRPYAPRARRELARALREAGGTTAGRAGSRSER
jgi:predicted Zn-dependent protease